jgi:hypothetical protein
MHSYNKYIDAIKNALFVAEDRRYEKQITDLHRSNQECMGQSLDGFMYEGTFYKPATSPFGKGIRRTLHLSLWDNMMAVLKDRKIVETDKQLIGQMLFKLLDPCFSHQDIRDAIPECIIDVCGQEITSLSRCRNPGFFLNHPRDFRQYDEILPKIEFYSAARLIY